MKKMTICLAGAMVFTAGTLMAAPPHNRPAPPQVVVKPQPRRPAPPKVVVKPQPRRPAPPKVVIKPQPPRPAPPPPPRHHHKPPRPRYTFGGGLFNPLNWFF